MGEGGTPLTRVQAATPLLRMLGRNALLWRDGEGTKALPAPSTGAQPWYGGIGNGGCNNPPAQDERSGGDGETVPHLASGSDALFSFDF